MGYCALLQEWNTVGVASGTTTQTERGWLDLADYQDVIFSTTCANVTVGVPTTLNFQTAPTVDNDLFLTMGSFLLAPGQTQTLIRYQTATTPLARYVRWQLTAGAATTVTFRIFLEAVTRGARIDQHPLRA